MAELKKDRDFSKSAQVFQLPNNFSMLPSLENRKERLFSHAHTKKIAFEIFYRKIINNVLPELN